MIAVYGDSYTDINPQDMIDYDLGRLPWPLHLKRILGQDLDNYGRSATGLWYSYQKFLKTYKNYTTIVYGYTDYTRWNNINYRQYGDGSEDFHGPLAHICYEYQMGHVPKDYVPLAELLIKAHPFLYNDQFQLFVYQTIFDSVNTLCRQHNIKLINFMPFEMVNHSQIQISIDSQSGACLTNLINVSHGEYYERAKDNKEIPRFPQVRGLIKRNDRRHCHINPYNNRVLAEIIAEALDQNTGHANLADDSRFSFDPAHLQHLIGTTK